MAKQHNSIQPVAFILPQDSELRHPTLYVMAFPDAWKEPLARLQGQVYGRPGEYNTPRIDGLNRVLRGLVPGLFALPQALREFRGPRPLDGPLQQQPWLIAKHPLDTFQIWNLVKGWLSANYSECRDYQPVRGDMSVKDLVWEKRTFSVVQTTAENGTAKLDGLAYSWLPALIAQELIDRKMVITPLNQKRHLLRVTQETGTDLISWPPCYWDDGGKRWPYSYALSITVQTLPWVSEPRVHIHYGVRRYAGNERPLLKNGHLFMNKNANTVLMHLKHGLLDNSEVSQAMVMGKIKAEWDRQTGERRPVWVGELDGIALGNEIVLPSPEDILSDPEKWIEGHGGIEAGILYSKTPPGHPIKVGVGMDVHQKITGIVVETMGADMKLVPPLTRCDRTKSQAHPLQKDLFDIPVEVRQRGMVDSVGKDVLVEIPWQTPEVRDMMFERFVALLTRTREEDQESVFGTEMVGEEQVADAEETEPEIAGVLDDVYGLESVESYRPVQMGYDQVYDAEDDDGEDTGEDEITGQAEYASRGKRKAKRRTEAPAPAPEEHIIQLAGGGRCIIRTSYSGSLVSDLPRVDATRDNSFEDWLRESDNRRHAIETDLKNQGKALEEHQPGIAFPEIVDFTKRVMRRQFRHRDPKVAVRIGFARAGWGTQFITATPSDLTSLHNRCDKAARDGLRQLGYLPVTIGFDFRGANNFPKRLVVAAAWMLRLNRQSTAANKSVQLPVVTVVHSTVPGVWAWVPGTGKGLMPYHRALLEIVRLDPTSIPKRNHKDDIVSLYQFLEQDLPKQFPGDDMVVLTESQNARLTWKSLQNDLLPLDDLLQYEKDGRLTAASELPGRMRLIRLRSADRMETPEYYVEESQPGSSSQGVWRGIAPDDGGAAGERLYYNSGARPKSAASVNKGGHRGKDTNPREHYAIPSLLEIVPAVLQGGDDPLVWALAIAQWRKMSIMVATDTTLYPLPMPYAAKMSEYLQTIGRWAIRNESLWEEDEDVWSEDPALVPDKLLRDGATQMSMFA